ncbi:hypothetical protein VK792_09755 [Mesobacterium sp. TK19101]|uniref:Magnesium transporter MgtE intracellular domain-containing protein n=1 Tax=Mesobacterium hydrothermale TaxID=3111907 RepID=A0ABU6HGI8_9RHOB|nr:hypothetical protein [Mesobacterium sp. TK19101]MEC3861568.1 hypothetical protein [Mesobacterium sp. TK19101]
MAGRKRKVSPLGPVGVIGALLIGSALVRLVAGAGQVLASGSPGMALNAPKHIAESPLCTTDDDLQRVLDALRAREDKVAREEARITARLAELASAEAHLAERQAAAETAEAKLAATMAQADRASEDDLSRLTTVYERMKPKPAAALFESMAPEFAAGFLGRMSPEAAAAIMAAMHPETANAISVLLAGRNANAGRTDPISQ